MKKRAMSGWSTSKWNQGGLGGLFGSFGPSTPCNQIPPGDPYRVPGNQCAGAAGSLSFDSTGNLVSAGSTGPLPTAADQYVPTIIPGISNTTLAIGAVAIAAFLMLRK